MNAHVRSLLDQMASLEGELSDELHGSHRHKNFQHAQTGIAFSPEALELHRQQKIGLIRWLIGVKPRNFIALPFIYGMTLPLVLLDITISIYQAVCFPLYGIAKVKRHDYMVIDRHLLAYLNAFEKVHCAYCSYANGLLAYAREITARTEQYFCPIKHSRPVTGAHTRYVNFLDYGDSTEYHERAKRLRQELAEEATKHSS